MPRPTKCRRICKEPVYESFSPDGGQGDGEICLTVDEYETIRIIDLEGQTQEQCALRMDVARTTITDIYDSARKKIAELIVNGRCLKIMGGNYKLCDGSAHSYCGNANCARAEKNYALRAAEIENSRSNKMKIAVTYQDGEIFQHFGHTEYFKIYEVEDGKVISSEVVGTEGSGHGALAGLLSGSGIDVLICGGIGGGAQMALAEAGIKLYGGCSGDADSAVEAYLGGTLGYDPDVHCDHHDHNHDGGHTCGSNGCGKHGCH